MAIATPFWSLTAEETLTRLGTTSDGLSPDEVAQRRRSFGRNEIGYQRRLGRLVVFLSQFKSPLILILIGAGILTIAVGEWIETGVIAAAVVLNTALGYWQENKAEHTLALLQSYVRTRTRVVRGGREYERDAAELVPGDIIRLGQGDRVPADARIVSARNLEVDESVLTGESLSIEKQEHPVDNRAPIGERTSMVWNGTIVTDGTADAVVIATGVRTEFGTIAALTTGQHHEATPLQRTVKRFSLIFGVYLAIAIGLLFGVGLLLQYDMVEMFLISIAVAVAAVPEGLPITLTVILAIGVQRLAVKKGVVRKLAAAETMGSVDVILTDKTGTLTQARMQLTDVLPADGPEGLVRREHLMRYAVLNGNVVIENPADPPGAWSIAGRPIEVALVRAAAAEGVMVDTVRAEVEIIDRLPFNSEHKLSATLIREHAALQVVLLGAPEWLMGLSDMPDETRRAMLHQIERHARNGERVVGLAIKKIDGTAAFALKDRSFDHSTFLGIFTFKDPLRPGVGEAVRRIGQAGVKTLIVTGDHRGTAEAVARELAILTDDSGAVLTGEDMANLSHKELRMRAGTVKVFARVTPEQKVRIVMAFQERGNVVAVTGDGINDAPALRAADIGVAVGSGTDVAKSVADLVILDDNFETIVASIEEGRHTLNNIRKAIVYLFSNVFDGLLLIGGSLFLGLALPLNALQILFVNFIADSFPAVAFAQEHGIDGIGTKPSELKSGLFDRTMKFLIFVIGSLTSILLFALYVVLYATDFRLELVQTFMFASFAVYSLLLAFSVRSLEKSIFSYQPFSNLYLTLGVFGGIVLTLTVVYLPAAQSVFRTVPLPPWWLAGVFAIGLANILAVELGKLILHRRVL